MSEPKNILVIDDDSSVRLSISHYLGKMGFHTDLAETGIEGLKLYHEGSYDLVLCDYQMGEVSGLEVIKEIARSPRPTPVILLVNYIDVNIAYEAMEIGAECFLLKPVSQLALEVTVRRTLRDIEHKEQIRAQKLIEKRTDEPTGPLIGRSSLIQSVNEKIIKAAQSEHSMMLSGPTGGIIRRITKSIHEMSKRRDHAYIALNIETLTEHVIEGELFGYSNGNFMKRGALEKATGGTVFLEGLSLLPMSLQDKFVHILDNKQFEHLGSGEINPLDVRFICYSDSKMENLIKKGGFREDLYYRLSVLPIKIPSLAERKMDIADIIQHCLDTHTPPVDIDPEAYELLMRFSWPHDVDHLEMIMDRIMTFADRKIEVKDLPFEIQFQKREKFAVTLPDKDFSYTELEREILIEALKKCNGNQSKTARYLGLTRPTIIYRIRKYRLQDYFKNT